MNTICDADLQHLKPGKRVVLKSFGNDSTRLNGVSALENYAALIGSKASVVEVSNDRLSILIRFDADIILRKMPAMAQNDNSVWVSVNDLKFVCRY